MELNNLKPAEGSVKRQGKRVGRGQGSGKVVLQNVVTTEQSHVQDILRN